MFTISEINNKIKDACLEKKTQIIINGDDISDVIIQRLKDNSFNVLKRQIIRVSDKTKITTYRIIW